MYSKEDIPSSHLFCKPQCWLRLYSWKRPFLNESYNSQRNSVSIHLDPIYSLVDEYIKIYDNFLFIGNFNVSLEVTYGKSFCNLNDLKSLIGAAVYLKNLNKPTCIDFILTNWSLWSSFVSTYGIKSAFANHLKVKNNYWPQL